LGGFPFVVSNLPLDLHSALEQGACPDNRGLGSNMIEAVNRDVSRLKLTLRESSFDAIAGDLICHLAHLAFVGASKMVGSGLRRGGSSS
jgi:hypothetical protein